MDHEPDFPRHKDTPLWVLVCALFIGLSLIGFGLLGFLIALL